MLLLPPFAFFYNKKTMKKWLGAACLLICITATAQRSDMKKLNEDIQKSTEEIKQQNARLDSMNKSINDYMLKQADSINRASMQQYNERNVQSILNWQRESNAKKKRKAYLYIGMGVLFLGVLVFGLLRKRKQNVA